MRRVFLAIALVILGIGESATSFAKEIRIGLITPLSGDVKTYGESVRNSFLIAVEEANARGGAAGMKITYVIQDDKNDATEAANAANLLVNQHRVRAIVGSVTSKATIPVSDIIQAAKIPAITGTATSPKVTVADGKRKDYMFRSCFIDPFQGNVMARFSRETLKKKSAAVLYDASNDYSKGIAGVFRDRFRKMGGSVAAFESYGKDDVDFSALLTKVKASGADVLFLPDYYNKVGLIAKQARERKLTVQLVGPDGWDSPDLAKIAGAAIEGGYFSNHYSPDDRRPEVAAWVKKYKARHGQVPDALGTLAYDATNLLIEAIRKAGSDDPGKIRDALASIRNFNGVTGKATLDRNGDPVKSAVILKMEGGKQKFVAMVNP
ncbi:MAG: ABC transporter substrate-binding protein [Deltaproteobacteria bacterium]|nr:MAG: ABC transporter substrate-binding protein [Deltaproteobacteria bacterium]